MKTYVSTSSILVANQNAKRDAFLNLTESSIPLMNIYTSTRNMSNGSMEISSFAPNIEIETIDDGWSLPNDTSHNNKNMIPDLFGDFDLSLPSFDSNQTAISDEDLLFPDFDWNFSSSINSSSDAKHV